MQFDDGEEFEVVQFDKGPLIGTQSEMPTHGGSKLDLTRGLAKTVSQESKAAIKSKDFSAESDSPNKSAIKKPHINKNSSKSVHFEETPPNVKFQKINSSPAVSPRK